MLELKNLNHHKKRVRNDMKKLILLLFIPLVSFGQGEQLYTDGSDFDQEGNSFEWINYGEQDWSIENAEVVTYRDGTPISQVTDPNEWSNLTTGAWCYYDNDPSKGKLYNGYAVLGIHDNNETTENKNFAPYGWEVPTDSKWNTLKDFLIENGYNYDGTVDQNKIAKSISSTSGWNTSGTLDNGAVGYNQEANNLSGFNLYPTGIREVDHPQGDFFNLGSAVQLWSSSIFSDELQNSVSYAYHSVSLNTGGLNSKEYGFSVRFVRNASTASLNDFTNSINIYPNPSSKYININIDTKLEAVVFDLLGKELIRENITGRLDISSLEKGTYILNLSDGINNSTHKIIKE